jgi:hypothetical protein
MQANGGDTMFKALLLALLPAALLAGCAPRAPISVSEMFGFCMTASPNADFCSKQVGYCKHMREAVSRRFSSRAECQSACSQVRDAYRLTMIDFGCAQIFDSGRSWCERYCTTNYE